MKKNHGFSLIELMVVIAVIAILSLIGINGYSTAVKKGRDARRKADVNAIAQALALYRMDKNKYPSAAEYTMAAAPGNASFLNYINASQLIDPDKKNKGAYLYYCWTGAGGASANCRTFLVCAQMELVDNMNWTWKTGMIPLAAPSGYGNVKGAVTNPADLRAAGDPDSPTEGGGVSTDNWYCVASI